MTFGKVMGGGFPAAAFGGRADIMAVLSPGGPVYQAGTLSGNPVAAAAGLATLRGCTAEVYERIGHVANTLRAAVADSFSRHGVPHRVQSAGSMFSVFFRSEPVHTFAEAADQDTERFAAFFHAMLRRGVHLPPSCFESWFVSASHDEQAVEHVVQAIEESAAEIAQPAVRR